MKTFLFNKLIRDKLANKMIAKGVQVQLVDNLNQRVVLQYFKNKIKEESLEVFAAETTDDLVEELADVVEVIHGFAKALGLDFSAVEDARLAKLHEKGGFSDCVIVDKVTLDNNHEFISYYEKDAEKYPEITAIK